MNTISKGTIARTAALVFALVNQTLTLCGVNPLPFSNDQIYEGITLLLTVGASLWSWWKNNSFTKAAIRADQLKDQLKTDIEVAEGK